MVIRTYADKCATIVSESNRNFSLNPILSAFYGAGGFSRLLVHFPLDYIRTFLDDKTFADNCKIRHIMKLWDCGGLDFRNFTTPCPNILQQTSSRAQDFEMLLMRMPVYFAPGRGYEDSNHVSSTLCGMDYFDNNCSTDGVTWFQSQNGRQYGQGLLGHHNYNHLFYKPEREYFIGNDSLIEDIERQRPHKDDLKQLYTIYDKYSNMLYPVEEPDVFRGVTKGVYDNKFIQEQYNRFKRKESSIVLRALHFEGGENFVVDISDIITDLLYRDNKYNRINFGFLITFSPEYENILCDVPQVKNFFSHTASNFFVPYLESYYEDTIKDDRADVYLDMPRRLYFYFNQGYGKPTNLRWKKHDKPICTITGEKENGTEYIETPEVKQATKGVYYVDIELSSNDFVPNRMLYDEWSNLTFYDCDKEKDVVVKPKTLEFTTKDPDELYSFGDNNFMPKKYHVTCSGIKYGEKVRQDDGTRKLMFEFSIPFTTKQTQLIDDAKCMLFIKDGNKIIDCWNEWQPIHRTYNSNFIFIDCQSYLPNKYYLDVQTLSNGELKRHVEVLHFDIVNNTIGGHYT